MALKVTSCAMFQAANIVRFRDSALKPFLDNSFPTTIHFVVANDQKRERRRDELEVEGDDDFWCCVQTCSFFCFCYSSYIKDYTNLTEKNYKAGEREVVHRAIPRCLRDLCKSSTTECAVPSHDAVK
jgi:hypothetical protein